MERDGLAARAGDTPADASLASVVVAATNASLEQALATPAAQAVVMTAPLDRQLAEVVAAVEAGTFAIERVQLSGMDPDRLATWLNRNLPHAPLARATRDALCSDLLALSHLAERVSGERSFQVRLFTEAPGARCGYHVDTVPPGLPTWGVLKVYNGAPTTWVEPNAVESMAAFYDWLHRRDRVVREHAVDAKRLAELVRDFDDRPSFLTPCRGAGSIPAESVVVFRHLPADHHWSNHAPADAWIHSSPTTGPTRLVVNISPDRRWVTSRGN